MSHDIGYYLLVNLILTVGYQYLAFISAAIFKSEKLFDFAGGTNFMAVAIVTLVLEGSYNTRSLFAVIIVCFSRAYLAGFLAFRVLKRKGDGRFDSIRENPLALFATYTYQIIWVYVVSLPVIFIVGVGNGAGSSLSTMTATDYVGFAIACIGALCEIIADVEKYNFRSNRENSKKVCNVGLWGFSRHPNYFGEVSLWWGVFLLGASVYQVVPSGWSSVLSPVFTTLLLLLGSGIPTAEGKALKRFYSTPEASAAFEEYFESTPPLIPCCGYKALPAVAKLVCCCEFPMYKFNPDQVESKDQILA
jgi:steroid 5-alpha reductase family enzyme